MGMNAQRYVRVRLKALGAINSLNCYADGLRGGPKASSSVETVVTCDSDDRGLSWVLKVRVAAEM